ncbi:hypothetical protein [Pseudonocardia nigra]|uniref:hypothetical protein n=1 Tax=Pseudonocardia nigra TaxID=1921578 RepID=UPI001C5F7791|nr:hypothetical protein [Pseudonocardia nigra]
MLGRATVEQLGGDDWPGWTGCCAAAACSRSSRYGLIPLLGAFTALNYACGLTAVRTHDYLPGTTIGTAPGAAAYLTIGAYGATRLEPVPARARRPGSAGDPRDHGRPTPPQPRQRRPRWPATRCPAAGAADR